MNELRKIDRLDASPRFTEHDATRLNRMFRGSSTQELLESVIKDNLAGDIAIVSSFGAESAVLLHLVAQVDPNIPVLFLDTGKHFAETLEYRDLVAEKIGLTNLQILTPDPADLADKDATGLRWSYDPDGCCEIRKVKPLAKALDRFDASFTGRKAFQSSTRANLPRFEIGGETFPRSVVQVVPGRRDVPLGVLVEPRPGVPHAHAAQHVAFGVVATPLLQVQPRVVAVETPTHMPAVVVGVERGGASRVLQQPGGRVVAE